MGMFGNKYPYTNFHELNLDWILSTIKDLETLMADFTYRNKIEYGGEWSIEDYYKPNTIVYFNYGIYLSIKPVPSGIDILDETYWLKIYDLSDLYAIFQVQSKDTTYVYVGTGDITQIVAGLSDGETLKIQKGDYTCSHVLVTGNHISIIGEPGVIIRNQTSGNMIEIVGDNFLLEHVTIINPNEWYPEASIAVYGTLDITGNYGKITNITMYPINKAGVYIKGSCDVKESEFDTKIPSNVYTTQSLDNQLYGLYYYVNTTLTKSQSMIDGCKFLNSIEGIYFGDYTAYIDYCINVSGCFFDNMLDHAIYCNGGKNGIVTDNNFIRCNDAITMTGFYHTISNNSIYLSANRLDIAVTGVTLREAHHCSITDNKIVGNGLTGSAGIALLNLSGDPIPNTILEDVLIRGNQCVFTGSIIPIRVGTVGQTQYAKNIIISENVIDSTTNPAQQSFLVCYGSIENDITISNNIFNIRTLTTSPITLTFGSCRVNIINNIFNLYNMTATVETTINMINGNLKGHIVNNTIRLLSGAYTNITAYFVRLTATTGLLIKDNMIDLFDALNNIGNLTRNDKLIVSGNNSNGEINTGTFTTTAAGAFTILNRNIYKDISNVILQPLDAAAMAVVKSYWIEIPSSNRANIYTDATTNVKMRFIIL